LTNNLAHVIILLSLDCDTFTKRKHAMSNKFDDITLAAFNGFGSTRVLIAMIAKVFGDEPRRNVKTKMRLGACAAALAKQGTDLTETLLTRAQACLDTPVKERSAIQTKAYNSAKSFVSHVTGKAWGVGQKKATMARPNKASEPKASEPKASEPKASEPEANIKPQSVADVIATPRAFHDYVFALATRVGDTWSGDDLKTLGQIKKLLSKLNK
jgi:hypothetical protein